MAFNSDYNDSVYYDYTAYYGSESGFVAHHGEIKSSSSSASACLEMASSCGSFWGNKHGRPHLTSCMCNSQFLAFSALWPCLFFAYDQLHGWIFGDWVCKVIQGTFFLGFSSYVVVLTAMTLDHYVFVVHASCLSSDTRRKFSVLIVSVVIWLLCAAVSTMESLHSEPIDILGEIQYIFGSHMSFSISLSSTCISAFSFSYPSVSLHSAVCTCG